MFSYGSPVYFIPRHPSRTCNHYQPQAYNRCSDSYYNPFFTMRDMEARQAEEERLYRQKLAEERAREILRRRANERNVNLGSDKPRVRKIPIASSDEDQAKAARIILRFIRNKRSTRQVRQILCKLRQLRSIEDKLGEIRSSYTPGPLTFTADSARRILPISTENKEFLKNEENVMKILDELDGIQSAGADIVRQRRREVVKYAQNILETFDIDRDKQWTAFNDSSNSVKELTHQEQESTDQVVAATTDDMVSADEDANESVNTTIENQQEVDAEEAELFPYVINVESNSGDDTVTVKDVEIKDGTEDGTEESEDKRRITQFSSDGGDAPIDIEMIDATSGNDSVNPDTAESAEEDIDEELDVNPDNTDMVEDEFILV